MPSRRSFVITGGPGSGKSTLIEALARAGYAVSREAGREIIQAQAAIGGRGLPWIDPALFAELMLSREMEAHRALAASDSPAFFDRGVPDIAGYLRLTGLPVPAHVDNAARLLRYHRKVFIAPPWRDIYRNDVERRQTFDEAVRTCEAMRRVYPEYGYELVELPCAPVAERVRFVLAGV